MLGVLPGVIGSIQATEALKVALGIGDPLVGRLLLFDALAGDVHRGHAPPRPGLPGLRREPDDHRVHRLRRVLQRRSRRSRVHAKSVRIPPTLRAATGGEREVPGRGDTVRELLDDLMSRFPAPRSTGQLQYANVYVDGEDIRTLDELETPVREGATVILLPAMAGGASRLAPSLLDLVGNTPLVELTRLSRSRASSCTRSSRARTRPARSRTASPRR